jgi:quinoprotein relay system zinc metallohydrolase 2
MGGLPVYPVGRAFAALLLFLGAAAPVPAKLTQIAPGAFVRVGEMTEATASNQDGIANCGVIIGGAGVAVIDPGGSLDDGMRLRAAILSLTRLPIRYVIMTHAHPDHVFGGAAFLPDHPVFVGHWRLPAALATRAAYDHARLAAILGTAATGDPVAPTRLVRTTDALDLGDRSLTLTALPPAHTDTDLVVMDDATGTLWTGDLLFVGRVPSLEAGLTGWLAQLDQLMGVRADRAVPGHGPASVTWPDAALPELRYLQALRADVRAAIAKGLDVDKAAVTAAQSQRQAWVLFDAYNGHNATIAYKELQWE